jgi:hypothetical protein
MITPFIKFETLNLQILCKICAWLPKYQGAFNYVAVLDGLIAKYRESAEEYLGIFL